MYMCVYYTKNNFRTPGLNTVVERPILTRSVIVSYIMTATVSTTPHKGRSLTGIPSIISTSPCETACTHTPAHCQGLSNQDLFNAQVPNQLEFRRRLHSYSVHSTNNCRHSECEKNARRTALAVTNATAERANRSMSRGERLTNSTEECGHEGGKRRRMRARKRDEADMQLAVSQQATTVTTRITDFDSRLNIRQQKTR